MFGGSNAILERCSDGWTRKISSDGGWPWQGGCKITLGFVVDIVEKSAIMFIDLIFCRGKDKTCPVGSRIAQIGVGEHKIHEVILKKG